MTDRESTYSIYTLQYHAIFFTKYRYRGFIGDVANGWREALYSNQNSILAFITTKPRNRDVTFMCITSSLIFLLSYTKLRFDKRNICS
jgi:REP element-mobilizing transposase RayT